jgi:ABC-type branched-subunit amino acid transport system permease subunit
MTRMKKWIRPALPLLLLLVVAAIPLLGGYVLYLVSFIAIMIILILGLHILYGLCGLIHFGLNGAYALGAYTCALLIGKLGMHYFLALPTTLLICGVITLILGMGLLRLRQLVLALGTFSFGFAVWLTVGTVGTRVLGGEEGLQVAKLVLFGKTMGPVFFYYFTVGWCIICFVVAHFLGESRAGRAMKAIREDEVAASAMGIDVGHYVRIAFLLCGLYAGLAGALYSQWNGWIAPSTVSLSVGLLTLVAVVVGGLGSTAGVVIGTIIFVLLPQLLLPYREYALLIDAAILCLVLRFLPNGIVGSIKGMWNRFAPQQKTKHASQSTEVTGQ